MLEHKSNENWNKQRHKLALENIICSASQHIKLFSVIPFCKSLNLFPALFTTEYNFKLSSYFSSLHYFKLSKYIFFSSALKVHRLLVNKRAFLSENYFFETSPSNTIKNVVKESSFHFRNIFLLYANSLKWYCSKEIKVLLTWQKDG